MKLLVLVICLSSGTLGYLINVPTAPATQRVAKMDWIRRQKVITSLFEDFCENSNDEFIIKSAQDFMTYTETDFDNPDVFARLKTLIGSGVLAKGIIFTEYNKDHFREFEVVRDVLYYAKDFDVFFKAAAWARQNLNCGVFIDVFYSALIYRKDTEKLSLPAPYELMPNYFFKRNDIITGASLLSGLTNTAENVRDDGNAYVIAAQYTTDMSEENFEERLAYFNEDIGLNTYIFLNKLIGKECWNQNAYGEYLYHFMKQLVTRYNLERYSNSLPELKSIDWNMPIVEMYDPMLIYSNGNDFDFRTKALNVATLEQITFLKNIEDNIASLVTRMMQNGFDKTGILNNLVDVLITGENSYESIAFMNTGKDMDSAKMSPSVLEHYMTLARDPMFWLINKRMVDIIDKAISILPSYTRNELYFPGVEIVNVEMKALTTSFNMFETDITEALKTPSSTSSFLVKIAQPRLSHAPFSMKLNISSVTAQKGFAKIYVGPKMLPGQMAASKNEFMLLDSFEINLKRGGNVISRTSANMKMNSNDFFSMKTLFKKIEDAEFGLNTLSFDEEKMPTGFPSRLLIPKGSVGGLPFQLFVFVAPITKVSMSNTAATNEFNSAVLSPGYPLDLNIENCQLFDLPNALVKDIIITHKDSSHSKGSSNGDGFRKPFNADSQDYLPQPWEQSGRQMYTPSSSGKTKNDEEWKPNRSLLTMKNKLDSKDNKKIEYKSKKPEQTIKPEFTNKIDQWVDSGYVTPKVSDNTKDRVISEFNNFDANKVETTKIGYLSKQDYTTENFLIDPVIYEDQISKRPFVVTKGGSFKNIDKTVDKTISNTAKNVVKSIDKGIKNTDYLFKNIDNQIDSVDDNREIDITETTADNMGKNIDDNIHKPIYIYDYNDSDEGERTITVDSSTIHEDQISKRPFIVTKVGSLKNIDKTIDKTVDKTISKTAKNVVKTIDKDIKNTDYLFKNIDKEMDSVDDNKEIDITKTTADDIGKIIDDNIHKTIYIHGYDDSDEGEKTITVDTSTLDNGSVHHSFGFDTVNGPVLKAAQTIYDYVVRKPDTDEDERVYE